MKLEFAFCGECGRILIKTTWNIFYDTTADYKWFCLHCMKTPSVITYVYKGDRYESSY